MAIPTVSDFSSRELWEIFQAITGAYSGGAISEAQLYEVLNGDYTQAAIKIKSLFVSLICNFIPT